MYENSYLTMMDKEFPSCQYDFFPRNTPKTVKMAKNLLFINFCFNFVANLWFSIRFLPKNDIYRLFWPVLIFYQTLLIGINTLNSFPSLFYIKLGIFKWLQHLVGPILNACYLYFLEKHWKWWLKTNRKVGVMFDPRKIFSLKQTHCKISQKLTSKIVLVVCHLRCNENFLNAIIPWWKCSLNVKHRPVMRFQQKRAMKIMQNALQSRKNWELFESAIMRVPFFRGRLLI